MRKTVWCVGALLALLAASPGSAQQVTVEITPYGGLFLPVTNILDLNATARTEIASEIQGGLADLTGVFVDVDLDELTGKHKASLLFGGRLTVWMTEVFGVEGGFAYALSGADVDLAGTVDGIDIDEADLIELAQELGGAEAAAEVEQDLAEPDAYVWLASLKGLYRFVPQPGGIFAIHVGGGVALIGRGGDAFEEVAGTTDVGGVLNLGATFDVSPQIAIRLDVEDYLYSAKFEDEPSGVEISDSAFQNDLVFTGGLAIRLGRR